MVWKYVFLVLMLIKKASFTEKCAQTQNTESGIFEGENFCSFCGF